MVRQLLGLPVLRANAKRTAKIKVIRERTIGIQTQKIVFVNNLQNKTKFLLKPYYEQKSTISFHTYY